MNAVKQQIITEFRIHIIEGRRKYLVEAMEFRKQQIKHKEK